MCRCVCVCVGCMCGHLCGRDDASLRPGPAEPGTTAGPPLSCQTREAGDTRLLPWGPSGRRMAVGCAVLTLGSLSSVCPLPGASPGHTADPVPEQPCPSGSPGLSSSCHGGAPRDPAPTLASQVAWQRGGQRGQAVLHARDVSSALMPGLILTPRGSGSRVSSPEG